MGKKWVASFVFPVIKEGGLPKHKTPHFGLAEYGQELLMK